MELQRLVTLPWSGILGDRSPLEFLNMPPLFSYKLVVVEAGVWILVLSGQTTSWVEAGLHQGRTFSCLSLMC